MIIILLNLINVVSLTHIDKDPFAQNHCLLKQRTLY